MNSTISLLLALLNINSVSLTSVENLSFTLAYVYTPNGSRVTCHQYVDTYYTNSSNLSTDKEYEDTYFNNNNFSYERYGDPTFNYNCHTYAWYSQSTSNTLWMLDPSAYIDDGSYIESIGKVGDIVVYLNKAGVITHSGIVSFNSNLRINTKASLDDIFVTSKWGQLSLLNHRGDQCIYYEDENYSTYKFYKVNSTHSCSYDYSYTRVNSKKHYAYCSCGAFLYQSHYVYSSSPNLCILCDGNADYGVAITASSFDTSLKLVNGIYYKNV